jgi:hypothetical protein
LVPAFKRIACGWNKKLREVMPSYRHSLIDDAALARQVRPVDANNPDYLFADRFGADKLPWLADPAFS